MTILISIPNWTNPHGGLRVIMEWANRLTKWHTVYLYNMKGETSCSWFKLDSQVTLCDVSKFWEVECVILTSPHSSHLMDMVLSRQKCFLFLQMMEHMFRPNDLSWLQQCKAFYSGRYPIISISEWNIEMLQSDFIEHEEMVNFELDPSGNPVRLAKPVYYVGNGVNFNEFPVQAITKDKKTVLIEGWECSNPSKDVDLIAHQVAGRLKREGYRVIAYGGMPIKTNRGNLSEYYYRPTTSVMNMLYAESSVLIKASKYDARACAPMEAMTKGTVTARAIIKGDDDLINGYNCLRSGYDAAILYENAKELLVNSELYAELSRNCLEYVQKNTWDYWMEKINALLCRD